MSMREGTPRRLLITGASGVIGSAFLPHVADLDVICLTHRKSLEQATLREVRGDITQPGFGLEPAAYRALLGSVDAVVHAAASTAFATAGDEIERTNIGGTANVVTFAEEAGVPLCYVSTAFVDVIGRCLLPNRRLRYAESKCSAEALVRRSGVSHVIVRPSIVIGDTRTGEIGRFQGFYLIARALLHGTLPALPCERRWIVDFIPRDIVCAALARIVRAGAWSGEVWLTSGAGALTLDEVIEELFRYAQEVRQPIVRPRWVAPEMYERLIRPVFLPSLPRHIRLMVTELFEQLAPNFAMDRPFPSSFDEGVLSGAELAWDRRRALQQTFRYWGNQTSYARSILVPVNTAPFGSP